MKFFRAICIIFIFATAISCNSSSKSTSEDVNTLVSSNEGREGKSSVLKDTWMAYYYKNKKLGYIHEVVRTQNNSYDISGSGVIAITQAQGSVKTSVSYNTVLNRDLSIKNFFYKIEVAGREVIAEGRREGEKIRLKIHNAGIITETTEDIGDGMYSSASVPYLLVRRGFKENDNFRVKVFFEPLRKVSVLNVNVIGMEKIKVNGTEIETYKVTENIEGLSSTGWYDLKGRLIKEMSFDGFEARAEKEGDAKLFNRASMGMDELLSVAAIKTNRKINSPSAIKRLKVRLKNIRDKSIITENQRQKILNIRNIKDGDDIVLEIKREDFRESESAQIPVDKYRFYLKSTSSIQGESPEIKKIASDILSKGKNAYKFSKNAIYWMKNNINQKLVENFSALDTLRTKEGECQSISYLYAAILRASGIPCRIVGGIVYSGEIGGFMYHAWCQAFLGEWIDIDPTFSQMPADATHISFIEGEKGEEIRLFQLLGKLKIDLLEIEYDKV